MARSLKEIHLLSLVDLVTETKEGGEVSQGNSSGSLKDTCKIKTTVVDTVALAPTPKSVKVRRVESKKRQCSC